MAEYIEREKAKTEIMEWARRIFDPKSLSAEDTMHVLSVLPAADVVEVVRCKDCKRREDVDECPMCFLSQDGWEDYTENDGFCDRGERKEREDGF